MQMVVRASDNSIWTASFNSAMEFNNDWVNIPGMISSAPALAWDNLSSRIYLMGCASDNTVWFSTFKSDNSFNNDWNQLTGPYVSSPAMAYAPAMGYVNIALQVSDNSLSSGLYYSPSPPAMVTFAFDDANASDYTLALPLLQSKGIVGVSNIVTNNVGKEGFLTWDQVIALQEAGWEIASHTVSHPHLSQLDEADIIKELSDSKDILTSHGLRVKNLAYPFGDYNDLVRSIVPNYYRSARAVYLEGPINPAILDITALSAAEYNNLTSLDVYKGYVDQAVQDQRWLLVYAHAIDATDVDRLGQLIDYVLGNNIPIVTKDAALTLYGVPDISSAILLQK
jgi:peptidoglycan/xylan/chitin deacetylase (PgdA/CDA1 family)